MLIWHLSQKPESITTHSLLTLFNNYLENRLRLSHSGDHMITWFTWALIKASGAGDVIPWSPLKPLRCVTVLLSLTAKNHLNGEIHVCDVFIITNEWICPDYFMETRENCGLEDRLWGRKHACLADVVSWVEKQNIEKKNPKLNWYRLLGHVRSVMGQVNFSALRIMENKGLSVWLSG